MNAMLSSAKLRDLDAKIISAHENGDKQILVENYTQLADEAERIGEINACCYFLTLAYVYALELGLENHEVLACRLRAHGRV